MPAEPHVLCPNCESVAPIGDYDICGAPNKKVLFCSHCNAWVLPITADSPKRILTADESEKTIARLENRCRFLESDNRAVRRMLSEETNMKWKAIDLLYATIMHYHPDLAPARTHEEMMRLIEAAKKEPDHDRR